MSVEERVFRFPPCWEDDVRMNSLFAPFRAVSVNPRDRDSKIAFWESLIEQWCLYHKSPFIELSDLTNNFRRKDKVPTCLPEVVQNLLRNKILVTKDAFYQMTEQSWRNWAVKIMISNPLQWVGKVKNIISRNTENSANVLVHWPTVQKLGREVAEEVPEKCRGKLLNINQIQEISKLQNTEVLEVILRWLESQKLVVLHQHNSSMLVKFAKQQNANLVITEIDRALYSLEQNKQVLENNLKTLEMEKKNLLQEVRINLSGKNMAMAKVCLIRKKRIENFIKKLGDGVGNIENLIHEIEMAENCNLMLECYETGVKSLRRYFKENELTKDRVENARNDVEDVLVEASDIDRALSESINCPLADESAEDLENLLEKELEDLLKDDLYESNRKNLNITDESSLLEKLPEVPSANPNISPVEKLEKQFVNLAL